MTSLVVLVALLGLFACCLAYVSKLRAPVKLLILPAFMVAVVVGYSYFLEEIGKPASIPLPEESQYVAHRITHEDTIIVWLIAEGDERLYVIPYSREAAKELEEARKKTQEGKGQSVTTKDGADGHQSIKTGEALDLETDSITK